MASRTASDALVEILRAYGVDTVFGMPGDGINGIMEALRKRQGEIRFVQVRHEESAAFAACGYAKATGRLGVCLATSGPGGIHLLNGLYDAAMDGQPVLALTGSHYHDLRNTYAQQDVALNKLFDDVAAYNVEIMGPAHVENALHLACRTAITRRRVAHVSMAVDFQSMDMDEARYSERGRPDVQSAYVGWPAGVPDPDQLRDAARVLNAGKDVAILAGRGAVGAYEELEALAETLGAPIVKALLGRDCVPDDSPYTTGTVGLLGTRPSQEVMERCDTLVLIGTSFPYLEFLPRPGQARCVQIDIDPQRIGLRYAVDVGLVGDSRRTLQQLLPLLRKNDNRQFLFEAQRGMIDWYQRMDAHATSNHVPMKPQRFAAEIGRRLRPDACVSCDSGTIATWWARHIRVQAGQKHMLSGNLATMACGLPYAIGAQVAWPDRQVVAFVGDGGFSMLMADLVTAVKHRLPIKVFIVKNNTLGQIKWEQMVFLGNPEYGCELAPIDFAKVAEACGARGFTIEDPKACGEVVAEALAHPGPVVVEGVVDPLEPPMPAKIKPGQAKRFAESLLRGQPNRAEIVKTVTGDKLRELI